MRAVCVGDWLVAVQEHNQAVDPNLLQLADAHDQAVAHTGASQTIDPGEQASDDLQMHKSGSIPSNGHLVAPTQPRVGKPVLGDQNITSKADMAYASASTPARSAKPSTGKQPDSTSLQSRRQNAKRRRATGKDAPADKSAIVAGLMHQLE